MTNPLLFNKKRTKNPRIEIETDNSYKFYSRILNQI